MSWKSAPAARTGGRRGRGVRPRADEWLRGFQRGGAYLRSPLGKRSWAGPVLERREEEAGVRHRDRHGDGDGDGSAGSVPEFTPSASTGDGTGKINTLPTAAQRSGSAVTVETARRRRSGVRKEDTKERLRSNQVLVGGARTPGLFHDNRCLDALTFDLELACK